MTKILIFEEATSKESINKGRANFGTDYNVDSLFDLREYVQVYCFSLGEFEGNHRKNDNFLNTKFIGVDIDDGLSHNSAIQRLEKYKINYILGFTENHMRDKHGITCERFRILIELNEVITDVRLFDEAISLIKTELFPEMDKGAMDAARVWAPFSQEHELITNFTNTEAF